MPRAAQSPVSPTDVDRIVAVVLDHVEATTQGGGLSRAQAADARSLRKAAIGLGVHYGTGDPTAPEDEPATVYRVDEDLDEGRGVPFGEAGAA